MKTISKFLLFSIVFCVNAYSQKNHLEIANGYIVENKLDSALVYIEAALEKNKTDLDANFMKLYIYGLQNECKKMRDVVELIKNQKHYDNEKLNYFEADNLICEGKINDAIKILENYIKNNPKSYTALLKLGAVHINKKNYDSAIQVFYNAIKINPTTVDAYRILSDLFIDLNKYDENIIMLKKGLELNQKQDEFYQLLSAVYVSYEYYKRAEYFIDKAIEINSKPYYISQKNYINNEKNKLVGEYKKNISHINKNACDGKALYDIIQYTYRNDLIDEMILTAKKSLNCNFNIDQTKFLNNRILVGLLYKKKYDECKSLLSNLIKNDEVGVNEYLMLALLYANEGNYEVALNYCEKVEDVEKNPNLNLLKLFLLIKLKSKKIYGYIEKIKDNTLIKHELNAIIEESNKASETKIIFTPNIEFKIIEIRYEFAGADIEPLLPTLKLK